jgi:hypothetical protein
MVLEDLEKIKEGEAYLRMELGRVIKGCCCEMKPSPLKESSPATDFNPYRPNRLGNPG